MKTPFLGGAYKARSENLACQRLVNLYPELAQDGGQDVGAFFGTPGLRYLTTVGTGPIRGIRPFFDQQLAVVSGNDLVAVTPTFSQSVVGTIPGTGPVWISNDDASVVVVADGRMFQFDVFTNTFFEVTTNFAGAGSLDFQGGFFIFNQPNSDIFWIYDGSGSIDLLDNAVAESGADHLVAVLVDHNELWLFGTSTIEVWTNVGGADFPYQPISGAFIESGLAAASSPAKLDNSIFWLGSDTRGGAVVYRAQGYTPARVSTHAIELAIQGYERVDDAIGFAYQQEGHSFYVLSFPTGNATWVFDVATGLWHERAYMDPETGELGRHLANCHSFFRPIGEHVVGDYRNGNLYAFDLDTYTDNGDYIKWMRSWRALKQGTNTLKRTFQHTLQLVGQTGVGRGTVAPDIQGYDPQVMLRWSDDGGHTWSNEHWKSFGRFGASGYRAIWRKLGATEKLRDRVYEVSGTDPTKRAFIGAELEASQGVS